VAHATLDALSEAGIASVPDEVRRRGYRDATWPGRLELLALDGAREVLLDGAHNPAGAAALGEALDDLRPFLRPGDVTLLMAMMADKDVASAVGALATADALRGARVVTTEVEGGRAMAAGDLASVWRVARPDVTIVAIPSVERALALALDGAAGPVVVAGSLYLVGAVRGMLVDDPRLQDPDSAA
jgi:dihydrofolate synthase/folylpolyglutamate synthase